MNEGETFLEADERVRYEAATHGDVTITHAHRTALRRVRDVGALSDLFHLRDDLQGLIEWVRGRWHLTDKGRCLLAAHDRLADTRRVERPRLEPRPMPAGWRIEADRDLTIPGLAEARHVVALRRMA